MDSSAALLPSSHHTFMKGPELDVWGVPGEANFELEDLLDFPNDEDILQEEEEEEGEGEEDDDGEREASKLLTTREDLQAQSSQEAQPPVGLSCHAFEKKNFAQEASSYGLCVPPDELASQLEWLSAFNEDSSYSGDRKLASLVSSGSLCASEKNNGVDGNNNKGPTNKGGGGGPDIVMPADKFHSSSPVSVLELEGRAGVLLPVRAALYHAPPPPHVPSRARSKRARSGGRVWSLDTLMPTLLDNRLRTQESFFVGENELSSSSSSTTTTTSSSTSSSCFPSSSLHKKRPLEKKAKRERRNPDTSPPRRCSHCLVQKTPQWRAGPMGPKTLCNACGVRYKSGRLLPEYRPAGSPSFVSEVHSNSHKRVLEMRRLKEAMEAGLVEQQQWQQQQRQHEEVPNEEPSPADENCSPKNSVEPCDEGPSIACKDLEDAPPHHQLPLCKDITDEPPSEKTIQHCTTTIGLGKECQSHEQNLVQEKPLQPCQEDQPTSGESPMPHHAGQGQAHEESLSICKLNAEMPCVPNPINIQQEHHLQGGGLFMQE